jgi:hypothetical protein
MEKAELEKRIARLEREHLQREDPGTLKQLKAMQQEREDDLAVRDMLALGGQGSKEDRDRAWARVRDRNLSAEELKAKHLQDLEDEQWALDMARKGGQHANR